MASSKELVHIGALGTGLFAIAAMIGPGTSAAYAQSPRYENPRYESPRHAGSPRYDDARQVVGRTQVDLERAASFLRGNKKEQDRLRNAQKHLSDVDRHMAKGKFNKDTLNSAIGDIQNVLDHNVLQSQDRDMLMRDVRELRAIRSERG